MVFSIVLKPEKAPSIQDNHMHSTVHYYVVNTVPDILALSASACLKQNIIMHIL